MAKLLGVIRYGGKLGQTVGYRGANGKRLVRARVDEISNPRTTGQNIQRMVFATAAVSLGHLSEVLRSSVEGVKAGAPSLAYLRGKALNMLRTSDIMQGNDYRYALKGQSDFVVNPYQISKGSLAPVAIGSFSTQSDNSLHLGINAPEGSQFESLKFSEVFPNVALGDQLTIIQVALEIGTLRPAVFYCRFAAKTNELPIFVQTSGAEAKLNEAALDLVKCAGNFRDMRFLSDGRVINLFPTLQPEAFESDVDLAYGIIISNRETGKRSTSFLKVASDIADIFPWNADVAAPTYGNASTPVNTSYEEYCDNSTSGADSQPVEEIRLVGIIDQDRGNLIPMVGGVYHLVKGSHYEMNFNKILESGDLSLVMDTGATGVTFDVAAGSHLATAFIAANATGGFHLKYKDAAVLGFCVID